MGLGQGISLERYHSFPKKSPMGGAPNKSAKEGCGHSFDCFCTCVLCTVVLLDLTTALHHYFKPADDVLPYFMGGFSSSVSPATMKGHGQ